VDYRQGKIVVKRVSIFSRVILTAVLFFTERGANAEELARLFFTPQERQSLNQKRVAPPVMPTPKFATQPIPAPADVERTADSVALPPAKITGRVVRSSGNNTVWINHYPQYRRGNQ
jgi:hypothetical protein